MRNSGKRIWFVLGFGLLAVPVSAAALAYACTGLATVTASPGAAAAGASVTVNGRGFAPHDPSDARTEPAKIRFDSPSGPVLATASPSPASESGTFSTQITVPQLAPGDHVLIVTQTGADGRPAYGTPARQAFTVTAPAEALQPSPPADSPAPALSQQIEVPVLSQPFVTPAPGRQSGNQAALRRAVTRCRNRYRAARARTRIGRQRMARRRAACINAARNRLA